MKRSLFFAIAIMLLIGVLAPIIIAQDDEPLSITIKPDTAQAITLPIPDGITPPVSYSIDAAPIHGALTGTAPDFVYTPNAGFVGVDTMSYTVIGSDGSFSSATITLNVGDDSAGGAPALPNSREEAANATDSNTLETTAQQAINFSMLTGTNYEIIEAPRNGVLSGQVPDVTYTPDAGFVGRDRFIYAVEIDGVRDTVTVTFQVRQNPDLVGNNDTPPRPNVANIRNQARADLITLPGLAPDVAALVNPNLNQALDSYALSDNVRGQSFVRVIVQSVDSNVAVAAVQGFGGRVLQRGGRELAVMMPTDALDDLGALPSVAHIRLPEPAVTFQQEPVTFALPNQGSIVSQGVVKMGADVWHENGDTGAGVKIGVIDAGFKGFSSKSSVQAELLCLDSIVDVTAAVIPEFVPYTESASDSEHGAAVIETICDVAPDATVYAVNIVDEIEFTYAIDYLTDTVGVDIINASLGFLGNPHDGEFGLADSKVNEAVEEHDVVFTASSGNGHQGHYEGFYERYEQSNPADDPEGNIDYYYIHDFNPSETAQDWGNTLNGRFLPAGFTIYFVVTWDEWGVPVTSDFDLLLYREDPNETNPDQKFKVVASAASDNVVSGIPSEKLVFTTTQSGWYRILLAEYKQTTGNRTPWIQIIEGSQGATLNYRYDFSSVVSPGSAREAFTVGAAWHNQVDLQLGSFNIESYSSVGPTNTQAGAKPLPDGFFQPQVIGATGGSTATYPGGFFGTSGSAPHIAGAAALVAAAYPDYTGAEIETFLTNNVIDEGDTGADYTYGYGYVLLPPPDTGGGGGGNIIGVDTVAIYRASDRSWYINNLNQGGEADYTFAYGDPQDIAVVGDWDGDGVDTVGIYRNGEFYLKNSSQAGDGEIVFSFGGDATDMPVAGDWNGDGVDTVGIYRASTGTWFLTNSSTAATIDYNFQFGLTNEIPVAGDWNGDGTTTVGIYRQSDRSWYIRNSNTAGDADFTFQYGDPEQDVPIVGDWNGDGTETVGIYRAADGSWHLKNTNDFGAADITFIYGLTNETPVVGDWDGE